MFQRSLLSESSSIDLYQFIIRMISPIISCSTNHKKILFLSFVFIYHLSGRSPGFQHANGGAIAMHTILRDPVRNYPERIIGNVVSI